jgi:hypothetical protein
MSSSGRRPQCRRFRKVLIKDEEVQDLIVNSPDACEAFAQKKFGVPFAVLQHVIEREKDFLDEDEIASIVETAKSKQASAAEAGSEKEKAQPAPAAVKEKPAEEKPAAAEGELTPEFSALIEDLSGEVEEIVQAAHLQPDPKDDAKTAGLKARALKDFHEKWKETFLADERASGSLSSVRKLATQGTEKLARDKYPALSKNARRIAAQLLTEVSEPLKAHRAQIQEHGKKAAAVNGVKGGQVKEAKVAGEQVSAKERLPDINSPEFDKLFAERAGGS